MKLQVQREPSSEHSTLGRLFVDGEFFCDTLEDIIRPDGVKVQGETAIPAGEYRLGWSMSKRFGKMLFEVRDVPMFSGIRIHAGNTDKDTSGCLLVGIREGDALVMSMQTKTELEERVVPHILRGEPVTIEYVNP